MVVPSHPQSASAVLTGLREATTVAHRELEARLPFLQADFTRPRYVRLLKAYYGFYHPLEQALCAQPLPAALAYADRQKTAALAADLQALGLTCAQIEQLPRCRHLPRVGDTDSALGVLYVLEGATLGGQVLLRSVRAQLAIGTEDGASFLDIYGAATGQRWRSFLAVLAAIEQPVSRQRCIQAACATFALFHAWLDSQKVLNDA